MKYFTADLHFDDPIVWDMFRRNSFYDIKKMNECIVENFNNILRKDDIVYHLGDFGNPDFKNELTGHWNFFKGNHDAILDAPLSLQRIEGDIIKKLVLCHYPLYTWEDIFEGAIHLHGHTHGCFEHHELTAMDVGVDAIGFKPISEAEVLKIITRRFLNNHFSLRK